MTSLTINLQKISRNIEIINNLCSIQDREFVLVSKIIHSDPFILKYLYDRGLNSIADINKENLDAINFDIKKTLFLPSLSDINQTVQNYFYVYTSSIEILEKICNFNLSKKIKIIIPIEFGGLREGVPKNELIEFIKKSIKLHGVEIAGISSNFGCISGRKPSIQELNEIVLLGREVQNKLGYKLKIISTGGTILIDYLIKNKIPQEINQIRIGEAAFFGYNTFRERYVEGLENNGVILTAEIIEIYEKDTNQNGSYGKNIFGNKIKKSDRFFNCGLRKRALLNFGVLSSRMATLKPFDKNILLLKQSYDTTIVDIADCDIDYVIGSKICFYSGYDSTTQSIMSRFVEKKIVTE